MQQSISVLNVEELFFAALELGSPEARAAFLDQVCADLELRRRVERLLALDPEANDYLEAPPTMPTATATADSRSTIEEPGTAIGPYRLLEVIGEGGMGTVSMAEQTEPVRRRVALKVIKPGMDSKQVVARFEAERQALAMMDHPNIARVFDGGMTPSGRPYFVMELVRGLPITEYCDRHQLSIPERLELFVLVCRAVQHAHQKGVIHRDLKPSNVLVTVIDGAAVPKVIDFGVAKATGQSLTDKTLVTGFYQFVGTPLYVSPEQAELSGVDVDTRSDIYSLGVLLYELLTGSTPFHSETLRRAAFDEMRRILREEEPPKPSTRLSSLGDRLPTVSAQRKADPRQLGTSIRGELDWVVMKALEKDRRRRYETASDFAADVMRYVTDQPVEAHPPSLRYRAAKFARRNRAALMTAAALALTLLAGTSVSIWQAARAIDARRETAEALASTRAALASAEERRREARRVVDDMYTQVAEKWLGQRDPGTESLQLEFLQKALDHYERFAAASGTGPRERHDVASAAWRVGQILEALGRTEEAVVSYRRAEAVFGDLVRDCPDRPEYRQGLARCIDSLGIRSREGGRPRDAEREHRRALRLREELVADFPAIADYRDDLATSYNNLGTVLWRTDRLPEAEAAFRKSLELRGLLAREFPDRLAYREGLSGIETNLGIVLDLAGRHDEAGEAFGRAVELAEGLVAEDPSRKHRDGLSLTQADYARFLARSGRLADAEQAARRAIELLEVLTAEYPDVPGFRKGLAHCRGLLGGIREMGGHLEEAEEAYRRAGESFEALAARDPGSPVRREDLYLNFQSLGDVLEKQGRRPEAEAANRRAAELAGALAAEFPDVPRYRQHHAKALGALERLMGASPSPPGRPVSGGEPTPGGAVPLEADAGPR